MKSKLIIATALFLGLIPSIAFAEEAHGQAAINWLSLKWPAANFALFIFCAVYLYKKHLAPTLRARSVDIEESLRKVSRDLMEAEAGLDSRQERLKTISGEIQELLAEYEIETQKISAAVLAASRRSAERIGADTGRQIENEINQANAVIRREVILQATEAARKKLAASLSGEDDRKLRQAALRELLVGGQIGGQAGGF